MTAAMTTALLPARGREPAREPVRGRGVVRGREPVRGRGVAWGLVGLGVGLVPWVGVLAVTLPTTATARHWALAWVGLDCLEAVGLIGTGLLLRRGDPRRCLTAVATAVLLLCDAWFDTTTSAPGADFATALAMALLVELPLAALCVRLALRALPRGQL